MLTDVCNQNEGSFQPLKLKVKHKKKYEPDKINKILIRGTNWIGDAILTIPTISAIRQGFPDSHITLLAKEWVRDLFKYNKDIDEVITYKQANGKVLQIKRARDFLIPKKFDLAFLLQNAFEAALIAYLAKINYRIGYNTDCRSCLLTSVVYLNKEVLRVHDVNYYLSLAHSLDLPLTKRLPFVNTSDVEDEFIQKWLEKQDDPSEGLIGINPGAYYGSAKRWLPERYAEIANILHNDYKSHIVFLGGSQEVRMKEEISRYLSFKPVWAIGELSLIQTAALIKRCNLVVTNDSGLMHLAAAVNTPVVAIFGSSDPNLTGPLKGHSVVIKKDLGCSPCFKRECPNGHLRCMELITVQDVMEGIERVKTLVKG
ncbi:MAG: lipopolysaccharide heptosyltransferase II [bacterium]